jgi:serine/threonine protein phosphatase 1
MKTEIKTLKLKGNHEGRDFIVGDLHGNYVLLQKELNRVKFNQESDRLFCTGDLIDRGSNSEECLHLLYEPWFYATIGNHELMMLTFFGEYYSSIHDRRDFINNGGEWATTLCSSLQSEYVRLIKDKMYGIIQVGGSKNGFFVTHSELVSCYSFLDEFVWNRNLLRHLRDLSLVKSSENVDYNGTDYDQNFRITYVGTIQ